MFGHYSSVTLPSWCLKPTLTPTFVQPFVQAHIKKTSKLCATGLCERNPPMTGGYPWQRGSNTENVFHFIMITSSNGNIFRVTGPLWGNPPVTRGFPSQSPVTRSFYVFFDLRLNKHLSKQSTRRWFETSSRSLWRHCNVTSSWVRQSTGAKLTAKSNSLICLALISFNPFQFIKRHNSK